jgi:hypothetical protein
MDKAAVKANAVMDKDMVKVRGVMVTVAVKSVPTVMPDIPVDT